MKKFLLLITLIVLSIGIGFSWQEKTVRDDLQKLQEKPKTAILRFALVADSEDENELLAKALGQAKGAGVNFVIGLGDWSSVGTIDQLAAAKKVFDESGLTYYVTAGDHDLWDSRNRGDEATSNFLTIFGSSSHIFQQQGVQFVGLDNSDIYLGIDENLWEMLEIIEVRNVRKVREEDSLGLSKDFLNTSRTSRTSSTSRTSNLTFVFAHKTPFHPQSGHVMGEQTASVREQAKRLLNLLEQKNVGGYFSGDLHFFARFNSPNGNVKMTTIGAVNSARNFQGPRFAIVTVFNDYSWEVEDVEIR